MNRIVHSACFMKGHERRIWDRFCICAATLTAVRSQQSIWSKRRQTAIESNCNSAGRAMSPGHQSYTIAWYHEYYIRV